MNTQTKFKHKLEVHPSKKGTCPKCQSQQVFRYYQGASREFGVCERINNCGYKNTPVGEINGESTAPLKLSTVPLITVYPGEEFCKQVIQNQSSNFHRFAVDHLNISVDHLKQWNCGTKDSDTAFVYQNADGKFVNLVRIRYLLNDSEKPNCKRDKQQLPYSLKPRPGDRYSFCLFGEHLLKPDKIVCLVESEKTAIISSYFYPEFNWLATGGANKLTSERIQVLFNREVYYLPDADQAGTNNSTLKNLQTFKINYKILNLFPDRNDGYDLADALIDGLRPKLTPMETTIKPDKKLFKKIEGGKLSTFERVENYLNEHFEIQYNEVSNEVEYREIESDDQSFKMLNEANIYRLMKHNHLKISQSDITALLRSDFVQPYNPIVNYFIGLGKWNPEIEEDYIAKLCTYIPVRDPERLSRHFKKMLVRTVACAITKVYNKQAFILIHDEQNSGKSTFCRWLCPPVLENYITENISTDKDSLIALCENFLINMDELATLNKAEINFLKSMFSKDVVKARHPFGKKPIRALRRASFVGSTNKTEFLSDETGSVRWLCFELTGQINWNYKTDINIDHLWKQAHTLFKEGFKYELTRDEVKENDLVNRSFQIQTSEMELIQKFYLTGTKEDHQAFYTATDILSNLGDKCGNVRLNSNNIGKGLKFLGFAQSSERKNGGHPVKGYYIKFTSEI